MKVWYSKDEKKIEEYKYIIMQNLNLEDLEKLSRNDRMVKKYMDEIERVNEEPEFREYMSAEEDNRKIENTMKRFWKEEGLAEGREKGLKEGIKETAKKMKEKGYSLDVIIELTSLSEEEIKKL